MAYGPAWLGALKISLILWVVPYAVTGISTALLRYTGLPWRAQVVLGGLVFLFSCGAWWGVLWVIATRRSSPAGKDATGASDKEPP